MLERLLGDLGVGPGLACASEPLLNGWVGQHDGTELSRQRYGAARWWLTGPWWSTGRWRPTGCQWIVGRRHGCTWGCARRCD
jgi:hypothetical protein